MKYLPNIAGGLLGLLFIAASLAFFFGPPPPPMEPGTNSALFAQVFMATGYFAFVKVFELIGGILVAIPKTRNFGLLVLGPIIINIFANLFLVGKAGAFHPVMIAIYAIALYLLWSARSKFANLAN